MPMLVINRGDILGSTGTVPETGTYFTNEEFERLLGEATCFSDLSKFFTEEYDWEADDAETEENRLFEKAFRLTTTTAEGAILWDDQDGGNPSRDEQLLVRMLELASSHEDLDIIYHRLTTEENEIRRRNFIRKLFDKADALGYPHGVEK
jgi:hypothetical protein